MRKGMLFNLGITLLSITTGLTLINTFLMLLIKSGNQRNGFNRSFLNYISLEARWAYPDFGKGSSKHDIFLVGDSYAEGAGDSYLTNEYNYSIGHFLSKLTPHSFYLSANSGSNIPNQLFLLNKVLEGRHAPMISYEENLKNNFKAILFLYEGNDLGKDQGVRGNNMKFNIKSPQLLHPKHDLYYREKFSLNSIFKATRQRYVPLYYFVRGLLIEDMSIINQLKSKLLFLKKTSPLPNKIYKPNKICIRNLCENHPALGTVNVRLTPSDINGSVYYIAKTIDNFQKKFNTEMCLVYIPTAGTIYSPDPIFYDVVYQAEDKTPNHLTSIKMLSVNANENRKKSQFIRNALKKELVKYNINFLDSTNWLQKVGQSEFIHGRIDKDHFNTRGYQFLAEFVGRNIKTCLPSLE